MSVFTGESDMTWNLDPYREDNEMEEKQYIPKAIPTVIKFNSRASVKIKEQYYTFEYGEERTIPDFNCVNIDKEIQALTDDCNAVVDAQVKEIVDLLLRGKN